MNRYPREEDVRDDVINLNEYFTILRSNWWKIGGLSLGVGILVFAWMFTKPNYYQASATITPEADEKRQNPMLSPLYSLGFSFGGPNRVEDLEVLFKSDDLSVRVFRKYKLFPILIPERFDPETVKKRGRNIFGKAIELEIPRDWDSIRVSKGMLAVSANRKNNTLVLSFESRFPEVSANVVQYYLDEAKSRMQEEMFERANRNKKFIEEQIGKTVDALTRERLYSLYGQEIEREMMARNRDQFGFRIIDSPRVPDVKSRPRRGKTAILATVLSFFAVSSLVCWRGKYRENENPKTNPNQDVDSTMDNKR